MGTKQRNAGQNGQSAPTAPTRTTNGNSVKKGNKNNQNGRNVSPPNCAACYEAKLPYVGHPVTSKTCPVYLKHEQIVKEKNNKSIAAREAERAIYKEQRRIQMTKTAPTNTPAVKTQTPSVEIIEIDDTPVKSPTFKVTLPQITTMADQLDKYFGDLIHTNDVTLTNDTNVKNRRHNLRHVDVTTNVRNDVNNQNDTAVIVPHDEEKKMLPYNISQPGSPSQESITTEGPESPQYTATNMGRHENPPHEGVPAETSGVPPSRGNPRKHIQVPRVVGLGDEARVQKITMKQTVDAADLFLPGYKQNHQQTQ